MIKKIIVLIFLCLLSASNSKLDADPKDKISNIFKTPTSSFNKLNNSELNRSNILSATIKENEDNTFWIAIHCKNIDLIAGFQFELSNNLNLLEVIGERADDADFQFHHNKKGLILGFSMSGATIGTIQNGSSEDSTVVRIKVEPTTKSNLIYNIKSILAGPKGQKLAFISSSNKLSLNNQSVTITFNE